MSAALLKLIQSGATADIAAAVHDDPGIASCRDPQGVSMLLWSVYYGQNLVRDFLLAQLAAGAIPLDIFEASAVGDNAHLHSLLAGDPALVLSFAGDGWTPLHLAPPSALRKPSPCCSMPELQSTPSAAIRSKINLFTPPWRWARTPASSPSYWPTARP